MKKNISKKVKSIPPSGIRQFFDLVLGMKDVISLGVGEPDFVTPWNICEAAVYSIEQGYTSYTSNKGLLQLREELSRYLKHRYQLEYDSQQQILITVGSSEAMDLAIRSIINPGDKVIIPEPCYVSYAPLVSLAGGRPVFLHTELKDGFKIDPSWIKKLADNKTKAIILNYPSNPTGASYSKSELKKINQIIMKKDLVVISDEIYSDLTYDFPHTPYASMEGAGERTICINGFSKSYAMTGWRIGFACASEEIIDAMTKIHQYTMLCAPIMSQMAAIEALRNGLKSVEQMKKEYKRRREFVVNGLIEIDLECHRPDGAFYVFPSIKRTGMDSVTFANRLLKKEKVAVVPGCVFGPSGEGHIRISYASSLENLREALNRIRNFLKKL